MGLFTFLFGCKTKGDQLEDILSGTDIQDGFVDISLKLTNATYKDSSVVFIGKALYNNEVVELS